MPADDGRERESYPDTTAGDGITFSQSLGTPGE